MPDAEINNKFNRLAEFLDRHQLDGVYLQRRNNFAWITCGKDNHIANNSPSGVAGILATADARICVTNSIEGPRFRDEELAGMGIDVVTYPWHDASSATRTVRELIAGRRIAADADDAGRHDHFGAGFLPLPDDFVHLRWSLTPEEVIRYRDGAQRTSIAIEQACEQIKPGMTEHEIAGMLTLMVHAQGCNPVVTLVAADQRVRAFRHPIPTDLKLREIVMLVTCAEFGGLISNCTRFVSFKPLSEDIKARQQAVVRVDATINAATCPGKTLGELFRELQKAYADVGHPDEWKLHHQGGSTGYAGREVFATPDSAVKVLENQAFAWNPSITGVKSEDTILCTADGIEYLTCPSASWPTIPVTIGKQTYRRPDILVK